LEQEDYIKRQIDQLGYVLGKILSGLLGFKTQGRLNDGIGMVSPILKKELDMNLEELISIPADVFIQTLTGNKKLNNDSLNCLAEILFLLSENPEKSDPNGDIMRELKRKALLIYEHVEETSSTYSYDQHLIMEKIRNGL
jgi:hypothetical protein